MIHIKYGLSMIESINDYYINHIQILNTYLSVGEPFVSVLQTET